MELQELTKKNQEFIHTATNKLIQDGKSDEDIKLILEEAIPAILENQKKRSHRSKSIRHSDCLGSFF